MTTLSFDTAFLDLFLPITMGARVVMVSREVARDGVQLSEWIASCGATVMQATPATWHLLLESGWQGSKHLKILCTGEALPCELAHQLLERGDSLWNMYGPTETTVWSTRKEIKSAEEINIGRPIGNTQIYVLDRELQPVPIGVAGEMYIGGEGLARGYVNRPELTGEKFIEHPFRAGERLYRTGDLARYGVEGEIEFLGRSDHQVKIRGFRIELGEIESAMSRHERVRQAVVVAREDRPGDKRLVAYYSTVDGEEIAPSGLRGLLKESLADYMVPSAFLCLESFPLTPNGKIDRGSLPAPGEGVEREERRYVAPRDALELQLTKLWEKVLGLKLVGVTDDFFDIGGHSILAARVVASIEQQLGANLPLAALFDAPTIAQLADYLRKKGRASTTAPPLRRLSKREDLPLSFSQQRLWFLNQLEPSTPVYHVPMVLRLEGKLDQEALERSLNDIVRRHEVLHTAFRLKDSRPVQVIEPSSELEIAVVDLRDRPEAREVELQRFLTEQVNTKGVVL